MKLNLLFLVNSIIVLLLALGLLLAPAMMLGLYGIVGNTPADKLLGQFLGVQLLAGGLITLFVRDVTDVKLQQGITLSLFIANAIGVIVAMGGVLSKATNAMGWLMVVIYALLTIGFGYFRFVKSAE
jgi:hypothetical protein